MILKLKNQVPNIPMLKWLREMSTEECIEELKKFSRLDFGNDIQAWEDWWEKEKVTQEIEDD